MNARATVATFGEFARNGLGVPLLVMVVLAMMVLPLPAFLLDIFFTFNISLSIMILLAVIYVRRALEFATFPTVLLGATLLRLGLNVASTRIVLINGHTGSHAAGHVIAAFGQFVVGRTYALLTIGDGLVAQIPALLLSVAVAILVTRVSRPHDMSQQIMTQVLGQPKALGVTSGILTLLGVIPGMPNLVFLGMAAVCAFGAYQLSKRKASDQAAAAAPAAAAAAVPAEQRELSWDDVEPVDLIGLEVGYRLIPLVDRNQGGELMGRIKGVRKKLSEELGFLVQPVHIRDNLELGPSSYRITILGAPVGESEVFPDRELAINPGQVSGTLPGSPTKDPAFGLEAIWIEKSRREQAQAQGYTVVDASSVIATHLSHLLQSHAHELLGHEEAQQLLNRLGKSAPKLIEDLVPKLLPMSVVVKVLQYLLLERVPIRNLRTICETLAELAPKSQDPVALVAAVRIALGRSIVQNIGGLRHELPGITLDPAIQQVIQD